MDPLPLEQKKISFRGALKARGYFVNFTKPKIVQETTDEGFTQNVRGHVVAAGQRTTYRAENVDSSLTANSNESASEVFYFAAQGATEEKGYGVCRAFRHEIDWLMHTGDGYIKRRAHSPEIMMLYSESGELIRANDLSSGMTLKVIIKTLYDGSVWTLVDGPDAGKIPYAWVRFVNTPGVQPEPFELYIRGVGEGVGFYN